MFSDTILRVDDEDNMDKLMSCNPFEPKTASVKTASAVVTPYIPTKKTAAESKHQVVQLNHFVDYFKDEYTVEYVAIRVVLPTGIDYSDIGTTIKHDVATDGFSFSVEFLLPTVISDSTLVKHHWMQEALSSTYTAGMQRNLMSTLDASILNYRTSLGHIKDNERLYSKFTLNLEKQCDVAVCHEFLRVEQSTGGITLNVILKCRKATIQNVKKTLSLSTGNVEVASLPPVQSGFAMPPSRAAPQVTTLLPSPIPSFPTASLYHPSTFHHPTSQYNPVLGHPHVPNMSGHHPAPSIGGQLLEHGHVPAMKFDQGYLDYLASKIQKRNEKKPPSTYKAAYHPMSSNQSVGSVSSKRSKYNVDKDPLVIHAKTVLPGATNQLALLQKAMKKAQEDLLAHAHKEKDRLMVEQEDAQTKYLIGLHVDVPDSEEEEEPEELPTQLWSVHE
jgi:hypothetical protein